MHDMLNQKVGLHGLDFVRSNQLEIIGFLHSGKLFFIINIFFLIIIYINLINIVTIRSFPGIFSIR